MIASATPAAEPAHLRLGPAELARRAEAARVVSDGNVEIDRRISGEEYHRALAAAARLGASKWRAGTVIVERHGPAGSMGETMFPP